jgi:hypothetical protein
MTNHHPTFTPGERVQTTVGLPRVGTVLAFRAGWVDDSGNEHPGCADIRWDDTRREVCTGVSAAHLAASSLVDALAELVRRPEDSDLVRRGLVVHMDDLGGHHVGPLTRAAALNLGFALLGGSRDEDPWW